MPIEYEYIEAEERGFADFPAGQMADAMRGTKSYPHKPRCPYRRQDRAAHWNVGYARAERAFLAA